MIKELKNIIWLLVALAIIPFVSDERREAMTRRARELS